MIKGTASARRSGGAAKSRREQLLDEAARELNSKGISMTSLTDVADRLGFSRASLYYYVEDREDLMFQVYLRSSEIMARQLGEAAQSGRSALEVVAGFVASQESFQMHGGDITSWLVAAYNEILQRTPDTAGEQYWLPQLQ